MTPPTLKQIIEKATPGPWNLEAHDNGGWRLSSVHPQCIQHEICSRNQWHRKEQSHASAQLIARCSPAVMLAVVEALESCSGPLNGYIHGDEPISPARMNLMFDAVSRALNLLNGKAP